MHKEYFYLINRNNDDPNLKKYYKQYCKILANVIKQTKSSMYANRITNSTNKIKAAWDTVKAETNKINRPSDNGYQNSPNAFNTYFFINS